MAEAFYSHLLESLPTISQQSDPSTVLRTYRLHVKKRVDDAIQSQSAFSLAWGAHALLNSTRVSLLGNSEGAAPLSPQQQLACLLVTEALSSLNTTPPNHDKDSPFFPMLVTDSLAMLQESKEEDPLAVERNCVYDVVESLLPSLMEPGKLNAFLSAVANSDQPLPEDIKRDLESTIKDWTSTYQEDNYVEPVVWARTEAEQKDLGSLVEQASLTTLTKDELLGPLPGVDPPFCRPLPPPMLPIYAYDGDEQPLAEDEKTDLLEYLHSELLWLTPTNLRLMLLPGEEEDQKESEEYRQILGLLQQQAFSTPLSPNDQRTLLDALGASKLNNNNGNNSFTAEEEEEELRVRLVQDSGLTPQNLPKLVENNPLVAYECVLVILQTSPETVKNEYLSALVGMDMTLHTMEVVNRLATYGVHGGGREPILHPEYLNLYVSSCIASCGNLTDRRVQHRNVRVLCIFVVSLLRNNIINVEVRNRAPSRFLLVESPSHAMIATKGHLFRASVFLHRVFAHPRSGGLI